MEDVLEVYRLPYDPARPVVCMDESSKQLIGEISEPIPAATGHPLLRDDEYVRNGVAEIFIEVEPLGGRRHVEITERRTRVDWTKFIQSMLDLRYPDADKVILIMDNLNTHNICLAVRSLFTGGGDAAGSAVRNTLHPKTRELAEYCRNRTQRFEATMSTRKNL